MPWCSRTWDRGSTPNVTKKSRPTCLILRRLSLVWFVVKFLIFHLSYYVKLINGKTLHCTELAKKFVLGCVIPPASAVARFFDQPCTYMTRRVKSNGGTWETCSILNNLYKTHNWFKVVSFTKWQNLKMKVASKWPQISSGNWTWPLATKTAGCAGTTTQ